jgi:hypothetical protein
MFLERVPENDRLSYTSPVGNLSTNTRCIEMIHAHGVKICQMDVHK